MCGIWSLIDKNNTVDIQKFLNDFWNIKHRGPDNSHFETFDNTYVGFHRLAIMDTSFKSNQPYVVRDKTRTIVFICNGEIYNYKDIDKQYGFNIGTSDCLVIPKLYIHHTNHHSIDSWLELFTNYIKGEYAFILFEFDDMMKLSKYFVGRDHVGVRPLYYGKSNNIDYFCSEMKGLNSFDGHVVEFKPGTILSVSNDLTQYYYRVYKTTDIYDTKQITNNKEMDYLKNVRVSVINSIKRRLIADRPIAFLLSGGVDSSLVAAISARILGQPIRTFCCGIKGSTDMEYARMVAKHIGSNHTEVYFTEEEGLEAIDDVVKTIETWDTTTVRASVGQYLVSKYIGTNTDCRVVMVGEGPDEVCSSYLFNFYAPDGDSLDSCSKEYVENIHMYDGRRADRCVSRWGLEARVPFLDPEFIRAYWSIPSEFRHPKYKGYEKYWLRKAFDSYNFLPEQVLWRKKEAFSDGVSSKEKSWYSIIQDYCNEKISTIDSNLYQNETIQPSTNEAKWFMHLFIKYYGTDRISIIPGYWQPKWDKDGNEITEYIDPSARVLDVYE